MANAIKISGFLVVAGVVSANLSGAAVALPTVPAFRVVTAARATSTAVVVNPSTAGGPGTALVSPFHGVVWFERVHILPREIDVGLLVSEQVIEVEVFNAYRARARVLSAITVEGAAGISVDDPYGTPTHYPAGESKTYNVRALTQGDPNIDDVVTWVFTGVDEVGTTLAVSGARLVPWPFQANLAEDLIERFGMPTRLLESRDGSEQRIQLRGAAQTMGMEYAFVMPDARAAGHANALVYGWQGQAYGVPHWGYATPLSVGVNLNFGATTIVVDTDDVPYEVGGQVFIWSDPYTWEALTISAVNVGSLELSTGARKTWLAGTTWVMPLVTGRLSPEESLSWEDLEIGTGRLAFSVDAFARTPAVASFTQYQGYDVLDQRVHDRQGKLEEQSRRRFVLLDNVTGKRQAYIPTAAPAPLRTFLWTCASRAEVAQLRAFLDARKGRAVPFWLPSYQQDLVLAADAANAATSLTVQRIAYALQMFPSTGARRHLALYPHGGGTLTLRKVSDATDGDPTESLALSSALPQAYPAATTIVSFLKLCRLEDDDVEIRWLGENVARASLRFRELPNEAPV